MSMLLGTRAAAAQDIGREVGVLQLRRMMQASGVDGSPTTQIVRGYSINKNAPHRSVTHSASWPKLPSDYGRSSASINLLLATLALDDSSRTWRIPMRSTSLPWPSDGRDRRRPYESWERHRDSSRGRAPGLPPTEGGHNTHTRTPPGRWIIGRPSLEAPIRRPAYQRS